MVSEITFKSSYSSIKTQYQSGVETFWPFQNNQTVFKTNKSISRNIAMSISKLHFCTVNINVSHRKLKLVMVELILIFVSMVEIKKFIEIISYRYIFKHFKLLPFLCVRIEFDLKILFA